MNTAALREQIQKAQKHEAETNTQCMGNGAPESKVDARCQQHGVIGTRGDGGDKRKQCEGRNQFEGERHNVIRQSEEQLTHPNGLQCWHCATAEFYFYRTH